MKFLNEETVAVFVEAFNDSGKNGDGRLFKMDNGEVIIGHSPEIMGGYLFFTEHCTKERRCCLCDRIISINRFEPSFCEADEM